MSEWLIFKYTELYTLWRLVRPDMISLQLRKNLDVLGKKPLNYLKQRIYVLNFLCKWWSQEEKIKKFFVYGKVDGRHTKTKEFL